MAAPYTEEYEFALEVVKKGGEIINKAFHREKQITEKSFHTDLVTETDQEVEKVLIKSLQEKFPNSRFIGEESVAEGHKCELTDSPTWVIDPIDGTTNFIHSNPNICTILAFMVNKEVEFGIVYNPVLDQLWTARKGQGSFYNGKKISVSSCKNLDSSLIVLEVGSATKEREEMLKFNYTNLFNKVRSIRTYGSAGINLAYLAMGSVDLYFEVGFHIWDYAGPALIVREAGGVVKDVSGDQIDYLARNLIAASTPELLEATLPQIKYIKMESD